MAYIYEDVESLEQTEPVGSKQCVALVQYYAGVPHTSTWRKGDDVRGNLILSTGTAIATFVDKRYQSNASGNHAAFYIKQDAGGIWIMDQWNSSLKTKVSMRRIPFLGKDKNGNYNNPSNNGDAFSVIK